MSHIIKINNAISIPEDEIVITASRSSGPGGQNVNKVSTKVTLRFNIAESSYMTDDQKARVSDALRNIINKRGCIVLHEESSRSQATNRRRIIEKFSVMVARSLKTRKKRIATKTSRAKKEQRLEEKKIQARKKNKRRRVVVE